MIKDAVDMFNKYKFQKFIQQQFFGRIVDYMDYVLPFLIKGKHTINNELECVGSQYLHLYYVPTSDKNFNYVVYRYEQGPDLIFLVDKRFDSTSVKVFRGAEDLKEKIEQGYLKKNSKGELVFKDMKSLQSFIRESRGTLQNEEPTTEEVLKGNHKKYIFEVDDGLKAIGKGTRIEANPWFSFDDQLAVFDLCNCMICGVSSHKGEDTPKKFIKDMKDINHFIKDLEKGFPKDFDQD